MGGLALNSILVEEGIAITLVYVDVTKGWLVTDSGLQSESPRPQYISASCGTPTTSPCGDYKIHTFNSSGCFQVTDAGPPTGNTNISYSVVAGGGGARCAAGGAGGCRGGRCASGHYAARP